MKDLGAFSKIHLALEPVDFRKQINGLLVLVKERLEAQPFEPKSIFVFVNKSKTSLRMLYWDMTGYALWSKVLEKEKFKWPRKGDGGKLMLSAKDLKWLLQGVDIQQIKVHEPLNFQETF